MAVYRSGASSLERRFLEALGVRLEEQNDPERICGALWFHGTAKQREAFGKGTEGRGSGERPPEAWWDDCVATVGKA